MYKIKLVQESDIEILSEVFAKSFSEADSERPWDKDHSKKYLEYWLKKQPDMFFGAFDDNWRPVGAVALNIKPWRTGIRCNDMVIFVNTENQKQGIAKLLLQKVITEAMNKYGATSLEAITFASEEFPLAWYKRIGINPDEHTVLIKGECADILSRLA